MREDTIRRLDEAFQKHPVTMAGPVPESEVARLEQEAGFALPEEYKMFVAHYGGAIVGPYSVYGLRGSDAMGDNESSAIDVTRNFRAQRWPGTEDWLVISCDHSGNPIGLDCEGRVWISDHDSRSIDPLANSFEEYLRLHCLKLPEGG